MSNERAEWLKRKNKIESYRKQNQGIIDDLRVCISYTPNRDNDLLCFMEQYLKAEIKDRPRLLEQIKCCIEGEEYENPFLAYNCYGEKDIEKLANILDDFIDSLKTSNGVFEDIEKVIKNTIIRINELHDKACGQLIDSWRSERLIEYLIAAIEYTGYENMEDVIKANKLW